jgi:hypothetical protein
LTFAILAGTPVNASEEKEWEKKGIFVGQSEEK